MCYKLSSGEPSNLFPVGHSTAAGGWVVVTQHGRRSTEETAHTTEVPPLT